MKPETEAALRARAPEQMAEILALMLECMTPQMVAETFVEEGSTEFTSWGATAFEAIVRQADKDQSVRAVAILAEELDAEDFVEGLEDGNDLSRRGEKIYEQMSLHFEPNADLGGLIHEAICEGRSQDAIDLLGEMTGEQFRTVEAQTNLFPHRAPKKPDAKTVLADW